jgi:serine/threonine-protein kinase
LFYVMPYLKEGSLRDLLNEKKRLPVNEALSIVSDVAEALESAHEGGLVHCDIKPENILMSAGHAVLADFGIARAQHVQGRPWRAIIDSSGGTPAYISPEQATGDHTDARSDVYSLGCVLYEMLTGQAPFSADSDQQMIAHRFTKPVPRIDEVVRSVPAGMSLAVAKAMSVTPQLRFRSVGHFMRAVESECATTMSVTARSSRRWSERLGILGFRLAHRFRGGLKKSVEESKEGFKAAAAGSTGSGWGQRQAG